MPTMLRIGCALLAYSPSCCFLIMFTKRPQLVIIALASAFAWLCSALMTAILWNLFHIGHQNIWPLLIIFSALFQECARFAIIYAYRRTEGMIKKSSPHSNEVFPLNDISSSLAAGIGFGTMHSMMLYGSVLASSDGSGVLFEDSCETVPLVLVSALTSLGFCILDVILMCLAFTADRYRSKILVGVICGLHIVAGLSTLANEQTNGCKVSLSLIFIVILIALSLLAWLRPVFLKGFE
jgi:hypothetical protein